MGLYTDRVLPRLIDAALGRAEMDPYRALATAGLAGTVVEIGFGSGLNVGHYPPEVTRVLAVEPAPAARRLAGPRIEAAPVPIELVGLTGERVPLPDGAADAVLTTWTLCTIPDLAAALGEIRRLLRPGGRLHFVEHGLHPDPRVQAWQHRLDRLQGRLFGGCHLDRPIDGLITAAGFDLDRLDHHHLRGPRLTGYLYEGTATSP